LLGWRKGVRQKKTETRRKIIGGNRKACRDYNHIMGQDQASASGRGSDDVVGYRWEFARRFAEGIMKLAGNMSGDRQRRSEDLRQECRRLPD
ncbi:hypothetical protein GW17_00062120, partial [Ensete ventricosum]